MSKQSSASPVTDSAQLYAACGSADPLVQARAYETLWAYLYRIASFMMRDQPGADGLAQECAQIALERIYNRLAECQEPAAFRAWARRIVSHIVIDELRRRRRLVSLDDSETNNVVDRPVTSDPSQALEPKVLQTVGQSELRRLLDQAPISDRSRRVILGRYFDGLADEQLAQSEGELARQAVLPSHVQVTRAKNIAKLRDWEQLRRFLGAEGDE